MSTIPSISSGDASLRLPASGIVDRQRAFLDAMGRHGVGPRAESKPGEKRDEARVAAEQFVAATFLQPILKEIRSQNRAAPPFGPTDAEKALGPMMDAQLADRMVKASQFGLVERIASDLRKRAAGTL